MSGIIAKIAGAIVGAVSAKGPTGSEVDLWAQDPGDGFTTGVEKTVETDSYCQYQINVGTYTLDTKDCKIFQKFHDLAKKVRDEYNPKIKDKMNAFFKSTMETPADGKMKCEFLLSVKNQSLTITGKNETACTIYKEANKLAHERDTKLREILGAVKKLILKNYKSDDEVRFDNFQKGAQDQFKANEEKMDDQWKKFEINTEEKFDEDKQKAGDDFNNNL